MLVNRGNTWTNLVSIAPGAALNLPNTAPAPLPGRNACTCCFLAMLDDEIESTSMDTHSKLHESAAYHEGGHAVIGLRHGATLLFVQLDPDGRGRCDFAREALIGECVIRVAMAGPAAEYIHCHPNEKAFCLADCNASTGDLDDVNRYCCSYPPQERQHVEDEHWAATCQMLLSNWPSIQSVATKLIAHRSGPHLRGAVIAALI